MKFTPTVHDALIPTHIRANAKKGVPVIGPPDLCRGRSLAICGAGPSLTQPEGHDEVWGCNRAALYVECTHAVCIDPSRVMCDVWEDPPEVVYFLASVVHPDLIEHLTKHRRRVALFHSLHTGRQVDEAAMYGRLFARTCVTHSGMNVVCRAVDLALWLGYHVTLYGCDMAFGTELEMYTDGSPYDGGWWLTTEIDGRTWRTKGDMLYSARDLIRLQREHPDRIEFVGDTLPAALRDQPDSIIDREWRTEERAA